MTNFKHINADEQIANGTITTPLFAPGAVTVLAMNINANLSFNQFQALNFRLENVSVTPAPGNPGRLVYNTVSEQVLVDNGTAFVSTSSVAGVSSLNTLTGAVILTPGTNITIVPSGNSLIISSTGGGSVNYQQDLFDIVSPTNVFTLTHVPVVNSQVVAWNGLVLAQGVSEDYVLSGTTLTLNGGITTSNGDKILVTYAY